MDRYVRKIELSDPDWIVALKRYSAGGESKALSDALWNHIPLEGSLKELDEGLSKAFENSPHVHEYGTLWTAVNRPLAVKTGERITLPVWLSSSKMFGGCRIFGQNYYRISGATGLDMEQYSIADQRLHLEFEALVKKGQTFIAGERRKENVWTYFYNELNGGLDEEYVDVEFIPLTRIKE